MDAPPRSLANQSIHPLQPAGPDANAPAILLIDDNEAFREIAAAWLRERYRVVVASDALVGLAMAERLRPALILLDIMMPGMTGVDFLQALRARDDLRDTPVVVVTAYSAMDDMDAAQALRPRFILKKPFDRQAVIDCVESALGGSAALAPAAEDEERAALAKKLVHHLHCEGLQVLEAICGHYPRPGKLRHHAPDVIALDRTQELLHLGIVETRASLRLPAARLRIRELSEQAMADGGSASATLPLSIHVPREAVAEARALLLDMGFGDRLNHDIFLLDDEPFL